MGLSNLKWIRGAAESRNGDGPIVDDSKADPALVLGQALLNAVRDVVEEVLHRREEAREDHPSESAAADDPPDATTVETDKETREPERSKKN